MEQNNFVKIVKHKSIRHEVFVSLKNAVLRNDFKAGDRLVEKDLADRMGISRTPIREAIRQLEAEGLVTNIPRKGVVVVGVSIKDALEIYTIRAVLEGLAAGLAAKSTTEKEIEKFEEILKEMEEYIEKENVTKLILLHANFHDFLAECSKNERLYRMIVSLQEYVKKYARISYSLPGRLKIGWEEHRKIVDAIKKGDVKEAENTARINIMHGKEAFLEATSNESDEN
jgi:DNA-binding GntR family transcriptional regulator